VITTRLISETRGTLRTECPPQTFISNLDTAFLNSADTWGVSLQQATNDSVPESRVFVHITINIKKFYVVPTLRLCVLYGSQNKQ
jgi:hypothetical protein